MDKSLRGLLGIEDQGKRIFNIQEGEVSKDEFEYCVVMDQLLFGDKGYVDTLGPTWNMTLDPRFQTIENTFVVTKRAVFGGDARQGIQTQLSDGSFTSSIDNLEQYADIIGEGRYFHGALIGIAYQEAIKSLFPDKTFEVVNHLGSDPAAQREYRVGLHQFNQLTDADKALVVARADSYTALHPKHFYVQEDDLLWQLIHEHSPNYFSKQGKANERANQLFRMFRCDLLGLIDDYAEKAKYDEWVKADGSGELADMVPGANFDDAPMVYGEVDMLERSLIFRDQLRTVAARVLNLLGVTSYLTRFNVRLTEQEKNQLVRLVFASQVSKDEEGNPVFESTWPEGKVEMATRVLGYLSSIQVLGAPYEAREAAQLAKASSDSKQFISDLKAGRVNAITRYTEPVIDIDLTPEEKMMASILSNPIKQDLFLRFAAAEKAGDEEVVALLAPIFATDDYEVSEETFLSLVAEATAITRDKARTLGLPTLEPGAHLLAAPQPANIVDIPDFLAMAEAADIPADVPKAAYAKHLETDWWDQHADFVPRTFGKDPDTGEPLYGEKKTAIQIRMNNSEELSPEQIADLHEQNANPLPREVGQIHRSPAPMFPGE